MYRGAEQDLAEQVLLLVRREQQALRGIQASALQYFVCHFVAEQEALEETQARRGTVLIPVGKEHLGPVPRAVPKVIQLFRAQGLSGAKENREMNTIYAFVTLISALFLRRDRLAAAAAGAVALLAHQLETMEV